MKDIKDGLRGGNVDNSSDRPDDRPDDKSDRPDDRPDHRSDRPDDRSYRRYYKTNKKLL